MRRKKGSERERERGRASVNCKAAAKFVCALVVPIDTRELVVGGELAWTIDGLVTCDGTLDVEEEADGDGTRKDAE